MNLTIQPTNLSNIRIQNNKNNNNRQNCSVYSEINQLPNYPIGYTNIVFRGNSELVPRHENGMAKSEKEFSMEDKIKIQTKYLWGKNWDEEEARARHNNNAENEIEIRDRAATFYLKKSTKMKIKEEHRQKFLQEKDEAKEARNLELLYPLTIGTIKDIKTTVVAEKFKNSPKSLDANIAGYEQEKKYLRHSFVDAIAAEKEGKDVKIPNGIILHGPTGCGKTAIARAVGEETGCEVFDLPTGTPYNKFRDIIGCEIDKAKERYLDDGKRTIIIVNEMDNYLSSSDENKNNLAAMKGILDFCADKPNKDLEDGRFGTTFIFTTNHPSEVDTDIFLRPEKIDERIKLMPPDGKNFEDVLKHYVDIAKETIDEEITKGRDLKPISSEIPYDKIAKYCAPNDEKGAFSCAKLKNITETAVKEYISDDNDKSFTTLLRRGLLSKRDITPEKLESYNNELEKIQEYTLSRIEELSAARDMGFITIEELEELAYLENIE